MRGNGWKKVLELSERPEDERDERERDERERDERERERQRAAESSARGGGG